MKLNQDLHWQALSLCLLPDCLLLLCYMSRRQPEVMTANHLFQEESVQLFVLPWVIKLWF